MKVADLTTGSARLHHALKTLKTRWEQTQNDWHDPVSRKCLPLQWSVERRRLG